MDDKDEKEDFLPGYSTVHEFSKEGFVRVMSTIKAFQALPQPGPSWDLNKSYPEFSRSLKTTRSKIIPMMTSLLKHVNMPTSDFRSRDVDEKFEFLVNCNDDLLERIGSSLDEADGLFKKQQMFVVDKAIASNSSKPPGLWGKRKFEETDTGTDSNEGGRQDNRVIKKAVVRQRGIEKPQLRFTTPVDNSTSPFVPKLKEKPNSLKPLSILPEYTMKNEEFFGHPYSVELNKWEPPDHMMTKVTPEEPLPINETPLVFVSTVRDLERLLRDLLHAKKVAVDLEHHSYRSFLGLTCLIQLSTTEKDYVIDGLALREELACLNEVFTNPKVIKVFHGASSDIDWLQKDFGLYVVNMFDTYIAAKLLDHSQLSLQHLLGKYCNVSQNKSLQLTDWRKRPLPNDMLQYARQDTHFLLYIYERLRNELIDAGNQFNNLLYSVYDQSRLQCLKRYEKPGCNPQLALRKTRRNLNNRQLYAFTEMYKWRDQTAREKDESLGYVLPNHMLLTIAETLPKEMNGIVACCDPIPPLIQSNIGKLHKIITVARELPLQQETAEKHKVVKKQKLKSWVIAINSIHDVTQQESSEALNVESKEDAFTRSSGLIASSWPQAWVDPGNWKCFVKTCKKSGLKFTNKAITITPSQECLDVPHRNDIKTPHGRYEISKRISEMLKDPKKATEIDMNDPLVKVVYETVMMQTQESNNDTMAEDLPTQQPAKILEDGEFIPFNPMTQPEKKRRTKESKYQPWDDSSSHAGNKPEKKGDGGLLVNIDSEDEDISGGMKEFVSRDQSSNQKSEKTKRKRRGKGKFLNRLKTVFSKNKGDKPGSGIHVEDLASEHGPDGNKGSNSNTSAFASQETVSPPNKRMRSSEPYHKRFEHHSKNRKPTSSDPSPKQKRGMEVPSKNKTGIFKAWKRDNRSVTYK